MFTLFRLCAPVRSQLYRLDSVTVFLSLRAHTHHSILPPIPRTYNHPRPHAHTHAHTQPTYLNLHAFTSSLHPALLESHVKVVVATLKRLVHINGTMASPVVGTTFNAIKSVALSCCVVSQLHLSDNMQLCTVSCLLCDAVISPLRRAYLVFTISCRHVWPHTHTSESRVSLENSACSSIPHFFSFLMYYMPTRL